MVKKRYLVLVSLLILAGNASARDWKEKVAQRNVPKVVQLDIYGTAEYNLFGIMPMGRLPVHAGCSGVYVSEDGDILTAKHCMEGESLIVSSVTVTTVSGTIYEAKIQAISFPYDLALLKSKYRYVNHKFPHARVLKARNVRLAQDILAIGHPLGLFWTVSSGIISYVDRLLGGEIYVQFDAVIAPGSSGGPVFDRNGDLVGIMSRYRAGPVSSLTGLNFMVGPVEIRSFLDAARRLERATERVRKYRLGDIK